MNGNFERALEQAIGERAHEIVGFLSRLVSVESITGHERSIQRLIAAHLETIGMEVDMWDLDAAELATHPAYVSGHADYADRPNLAARKKGAGGGRSLLLNGHVDTIPFGERSAWTHPPAGAVIEDGRLYGRGASDMKSGLAAMIMAVDILHGMGVRLKGDLVMQCVVDEEQTGNGTLSALMRGYTAEAGICCESSSMHVQPACIGRIWFRLEIQGKAAGIQRRFEGVNAIEKAYLLIRTVADLEKTRIDQSSHPLYPDKLSSLPCMVTMMHAGAFPSAFPDHCVLQGSLATLPGESCAQAKAQFTRTLLQICANDPWLKEHPPSIAFDGYCGESAAIDAESPLVRTVAGAYARVVGSEARITGRQGAADIRYLIHAGIPALIFGPGLTEQMHATDEYVCVSDVLNATRVLASSLVDWCGASL